MSSNIRRQKKEAYIKQAQVIKESTEEVENIFEYESFRDMLIDEEFADLLNGRLPLDEGEGEFWQQTKAWLSRKLPQYKVAGKIFGKDKIRKRAAKELAKVMKNTKIKELHKTINKQIKIGKNKFPNNEDTPEFATAVGEIYGAYEAIRDEVAACNLKWETGNGTVMALRQYVGSKLEVELTDVYKFFKEEEERGALMEAEAMMEVEQDISEGMIDNIKQGVLGFFRADTPKGDILKAHIKDPQTGKEVPSETIKGLKSLRLPIFLTFLGASLEGLSWITESDWWKEAWTEYSPVKALKYVYSEGAQILNIAPGEGLSQLFERFFDMNIGYNELVGTFFEGLGQVTDGSMAESIAAVAGGEGLAADPAAMKEALTSLHQVWSEDWLVKVVEKGEEVWKHASECTNGEFKNADFVCASLKGVTTTADGVLIPSAEGISEGNALIEPGTDMTGTGPQSPLGCKEGGAIAGHWSSVLATVTTSVVAKMGLVGVAGILLGPWLAAFGIGAVAAGVGVFAMRRFGLTNSRAKTLNELRKKLITLPVPECGKKEDQDIIPDKVVIDDKDKKDKEDKEDKKGGEEEIVPTPPDEEGIDVDLVPLPPDEIIKMDPKLFRRSRNLQFAYLLGVAGIPHPPFKFDEKTGEVETNFTGDNRGAGPNARQIINLRKAAPRYFLSRMAFMYPGVKFDNQVGARAIAPGTKGHANYPENMKVFGLPDEAGQQKILSEPELYKMRKNPQQKWKYIFKNIPISKGQATELEKLWKNKTIPNFLKDNFKRYGFSYTPFKTGAAE